MQSLQQYFLLIKLSKDCSFHEIALHKFSIDLSQNLTPEPSPTKTLSDTIKSQPQQFESEGFYRNAGKDEG